MYHDFNISGFEVNEVVYINKEGWLHKWATLLKGSRNLTDFPVWLQFFVKVLFQVINRGGKYSINHDILVICFTAFATGTGLITREELSNFYSSVLCLDAAKVEQILDIAYQAMTSVSVTATIIFISFTIFFLIEWGPSSSLQIIQTVLFQLLIRTLSQWIWSPYSWSSAT